jgi:hypothetical protein
MLERRGDGDSIEIDKHQKKENQRNEPGKGHEQVN